MATLLLAGFLLKIEPVRDTLVQAIADTILYKTEYAFEFGELDGFFPFQFSAKKLVLRKEGEPVFSLDSIDGSLSLLHLLSGTIRFYSTAINLSLYPFAKTMEGCFQGVHFTAKWEDTISATYEFSSFHGTAEIEGSVVSATIENDFLACCSYLTLSEKGVQGFMIGTAEGGFARADLEWDFKHPVQIKGIEFKYKGSSGSGDLLLALPTLTPEGQIHCKAPDLATLHPLIAGSASCSVEFLPDGNVTFSAEGSRFVAPHTAIHNWTMTGEKKSKAIAFNGYELEAYGVPLKEFSVNTVMQEEGYTLVGAGEGIEVNGSGTWHNLELEGSGEIAPFVDLFTGDTNRIEGLAKGSVTISGSAIEGRVAITEGRFENYPTGCDLRELDLLLTTNGKKIRLESLSGSDRSGGKIEATGEIAFEENFPFDFRLTLDNARPFRASYAEAAASGSARLQGNLLKAKLSGELLVSDAEIYLPSTMPVQMQTLEVTYINSEDVPSPKRKKENPPIDLALTFKIPGNARVNGSNLESEWQGEFTLGGNTLDPLLYGKMQLLSGSYTFNGNSFVSTQGSIQFSGSLTSKTSLYVLGEQQIDKYKIGAVLKGPIGDPTLTFRSNPPLTEKEILSWLIFGSSIDEITPFQVAQLSQNFIQGDGQSGFMKNFQKKIGIDKIDISSGDNRETNELSVRVGKYISRGVLVSLSKSITAEANQFAIEANVTKHFKVQAEVGDNAEGKMNLKWAMDY